MLSTNTGSTLPAARTARASERPSAAVIGASPAAWSADHVDEFSSARPVARKMLEMRRADEPLLAGIFLARGVHYYTRLPVTVLANKAKPFNWTQHKKLPVVAGGDELREFLTQHPTALCTIRRGEWPSWSTKQDTPFPDEPNWSGDNALVRLEAPR